MGVLDNVWDDVPPSKLVEPNKTITPAPGLVKGPGVLTTLNAAGGDTSIVTFGTLYVHLPHPQSRVGDAAGIAAIAAFSPFDASLLATLQGWAWRKLMDYRAVHVSAPGREFVEAFREEYVKRGRASEVLALTLLNPGQVMHGGLCIAAYKNEKRGTTWDVSSHT